MSIFPISLLFLLLASLAMGWSPQDGGVLTSDCTRNVINITDYQGLQNFRTISTTGCAMVMDAAPSLNWLYYTSLKYKSPSSYDWSLRRIKLDGTADSQLLGSTAATMLAVDVDHGYLFYSTQGSASLWRATLNGANPQPMVSLPYSWTIDKANSLIYYAVRGKNNFVSDIYVKGYTDPTNGTLLASSVDEVNFMNLFPGGLLLSSSSSYNNYYFSTLAVLDVTSHAIQPLVYRVSDILQSIVIDQKSLTGYVAISRSTYNGGSYSYTAEAFAIVFALNSTNQWTAKQSGAGYAYVGNVYTNMEPFGSVAVLPSTCTNDCSAHGNCDSASSTCTCMAGWYDASCGTYCSPSLCNHHGTCNAQTGKCDCTVNWTGPTCIIAAHTPPSYPPVYSVSGAFQHDDVSGTFNYYYNYPAQRERNSFKINSSVDVFLNRYDLGYAFAYPADLSSCNTSVLTGQMALSGVAKNASYVNSTVCSSGSSSFSCTTWQSQDPTMCQPACKWVIAQVQIGSNTVSFPLMWSRGNSHQVTYDLTTLSLNVDNSVFTFPSNCVVSL